MILTKSKVSSIDLDFEIEGKIKSGKLDELLLIVPTNRKIRYLKKDIINETPQKAAGKINLETIGTFSTKLLFADASASVKVLSEPAAVVLLKQSFQECKLNYFSNYKSEIPAGTLDRVMNVISEYKKHGVTPEMLKSEAENLIGSEKIKAEDIAKIYKKYQQKCSELFVKEIGDIYNELNIISKGEFEKRFGELYPEVNLIVIQGFDEFTNPEIEIINSAAEIRNCELFLSLDYYEYNPLIFSHLDKCFKKLLSKNFKIINDLFAHPLNEFQSLIRENLFIRSKQNLPAGKTGAKDYSSIITKITALTREKEIELIAKEIKDLITEKNIEPHKICIGFNLIKKYSPVIRDVFTLYGIPFNLTDRYSLSTASPIIAMINFLEILENDFYYKNIFRALSGGFIRFSGINLSNLLKASVDLKIISGYENWCATLKDAFSKFIEEDEEKAEGNSFEKEIYKRAYDDIEKLYEILSPFDKKMTITEFHSNFMELIFKLNIPSRLVNGIEIDYPSGRQNVEENIKAVTVFLDTLHEMLELFNLEYREDQKFPLKFFLNHIRTLTSSARYNIKEKPGYGVQITTLNEIRGLQFDYLFIAGLCDGDLPTRYSPEIFFSGTYTRNESNHQTEERYHFYQSLCSWGKGLYLSSALQEERQELAESNFISEFRKLFRIYDKNEKNFSSAIYSKEELLVFAGENKAVLQDYLNQSLMSLGITLRDILDIQTIKKAIEINKQREDEPFGDSEYTGRLLQKLPIEAKEKLDEYKGKEYSISQLETYALCPYKYFAERVLRLKPPEEPTEDIEALEMGSLLHNILYEFYKDIRSKDIVLFDASASNFNYAEKTIFEIAKKIIDEANFNSPLTFYEKEKILGINGDKKNSILYKFLEAERDNADGFTPEFFEISFGNTQKFMQRGVAYTGKKYFKTGAPADSSEEDFKAGEIKVKGKIDRIDIDMQNKKFKVVDYKLGGRKPNAEDLQSGVSLQLPLYMYAAKILINAKLDKDFDPAGAEIYSLKFKEGKFGKSEIRTNPRKRLSAREIKNLIETCLNSVEKYVEAITRGEFNLTTLKDREIKVCRFCQFKPICRIQEVN